MEEKSLKHVCRFCKKGFPCGRSLGGHIRTHLPKPAGYYELRENPKKTWRATNHGDHHKLLNSAHSSSYESEPESENSKLISMLHQNQAKRSGNHNNNNNSHSSAASEVVEQEEVAVAMCLIMLSNDVGSWGDSAVSKGNDCKGKRKRKEKIQVKDQTVFPAVNGGKVVNLASGHLQKGLKMKGIEVFDNGFVSNDQSYKLSEIKKKIQGKQSATCGSENANKGKKVESAVKNVAKLKDFEVSENGFASDDQPDSIGLLSNNQKKYSYNDDGIVYDDNVMISEVCNIVSSNDKRSKFECNTCNKVFHSYQALGGHRASHKKSMGAKDDCLPVSKRDDKEVFSIGDSPSSNHNFEEQEQEEVVTEIGIGSSSSSLLSKKVVQKHECPICFRVFTSGQALGGHKRSHLLAAKAESIGCKSADTKIMISQSSGTADATERSSSSESRDDIMLDLNLPPQEEITTPLTTASSSNSLVGLIKPYWWVESSHKHEQLLSLISN